MLQYVAELRAWRDRARQGRFSAYLGLNSTRENRINFPGKLSQKYQKNVSATGQIAGIWTKKLRNMYLNLYITHYTLYYQCIFNITKLDCISHSLHKYERNYTRLKQKDILCGEPEGKGHKSSLIQQVCSVSLVQLSLIELVALK